MSEPQHIQLPWRVFKNPGRPSKGIGPSPSLIVARIKPCRDANGQHHAKANAALIVRAVNAHDTLVSTLKTLRENYRNDSEHARLIDAALAKAEA